MQKKLIAAAVAALASTGAMAQVTLYGVADASYFALNQDRAPTGGAAGQLVEAKTSGIFNGLLSGSRLGVKAEDDIGGGLKGVVVYETGVNLDANGTVDATATTTVGGSSGLFGLTRQSYVGLSGGFGRVSFGRQYSPGYFAPGASDGFASATIAPQSALSGAGGFNITSQGSAPRVDNSIYYTTPNLGGVTVSALYALGETADTPNVTAAGTTSKTNQRFVAGVQGKFGPVTVDVAYDTKETANTATNGTITQDEYFVGAAFNAGFAIFGGSFQTKELDQPGVGNKWDLWTASVIVPIGAGNIHVGYGELTRDTAIEGKVTNASIAYTHALSKKTTAYVGYSQAEGADAGGGNFTLAGPLGAVVATGTNSVFAGGLRVVF